MRLAKFRIPAFLLLSAGLLLMAGCGSGSGSAAAPPLQVTISPQDATLNIGETKTFTATVANSSNAAVTWRVLDANGGSIDSAGIYTPAYLSGTFRVEAASAVDPTATAIATVHVKGGVFVAAANDTVEPRSADGFAVLQDSGEVLVAAGHAYGMSFASITEIFDVNAPPATDGGIGAFQYAGPIAHNRQAHTLTALKDGRVLLAGGDNIWEDILETELYDPATRTFSAGPTLGNKHSFAAATKLSDGRVLIMGGNLDWFGNSVGFSSEVFDPVSNSFSGAGDMVASRADHSATTLNDGRVLVVGGDNPSSGVIAGVEIYDPSTNAFKSAGALPTGRMDHTATLLSDGRVLIVGGRDPFTWPPPLYSDVFVFDPAGNSGQGAITLLGNLPVPLEGHSATLLQDGRVLIADGLTVDAKGFTEFSTTAYIIDPKATGSALVTQTGSPLNARYHQQAIRLQDGRVLILGGSNDFIMGRPQSHAEIYIP